MTTAVATNATTGPSHGVLCRRHSALTGFRNQRQILAASSTKQNSPSWPTISGCMGCCNPYWCAPCQAASRIPMSSLPGRGAIALAESPIGNPSPLRSGNSPLRNASNCNSSKTSNALTCTELDEARGYATLMQMQPETYTVETLAEKIGRSEKYVYARLRLTRLVEEAQQAFYSGKLSVAHAFEIARLEPEDQKRALQECFPTHRTAAAILKDRKAEAVTVRQLREWVEREIHLDLTNAPFDPQDQSLVPSAGSCAKCPKRTGNNPLLFPEVRQKSICTDRACYRRKVEALVQIRVKPLEAAGEKPLHISHAPAWQGQHRDANVLYEGQFRTARKKMECPDTKPAVVIDGPDAGKLFHVCRDDQCPIHARVTRYEPSPQERAARAKQVLAERIEKQTRVRMLNAIRQKLPATLSRPDLEMAALDYFERLGHDNHRRLCRVYGWEEKKTKASWGGSTVDYKTIAGKAVSEMGTPEVHRFLVVCALMSDLYCPGYNPGQALAKDSKLARTAMRYKINIAQIAAAVRTELSKKGKGGKKLPKPPASPLRK